MTLDHLFNRLEACHSIHAATATPVYAELKQMMETDSSIENVFKSITWIYNQHMGESIDQCALQIDSAMSDFNELSAAYKFTQELTERMHDYENRINTHTRFIKNPSMETMASWMNTYPSEERIYIEIVQKLNSYR